MSTPQPAYPDHTCASRKPPLSNSSHIITVMMTTNDSQKNPPSLRVKQADLQEQPTYCLWNLPHLVNAHFSLHNKALPTVPRGNPLCVCPCLTFRCVLSFLKNSYSPNKFSTIFVSILEFFFEKRPRTHLWEQNYTLKLFHVRDFNLWFRKSIKLERKKMSPSDIIKNLFHLVTNGK